MILFAILLAQYFAEHLHPAAVKNNVLKHEAKNTVVGIVNIIILFIPSVLLVELLWWLKQNELGLLNTIALPGWLELAVTIIAMDVTLYWWHRFNHRIPLLWRFHRFHHLDPTMNTTTALRFHSIELLLSTLVRAGIYVLMGFDYVAILIYEIVFFTAVLFHHSNISVSTRFDMFYRRLFSSPLMHRIHHSNKQRETDTNYGSVFSFWDRMFGSYKKEAEAEIVFGVDEAKP